MKDKKKVLKYIGIVTYIIIYAAIIIFIGLKHEHWADEAQAWLIARDNNFIDILKIIRYEGTPPLWHFILRIFILFGFKYTHLIFLTTAITISGVILLFRNKNIPWVLKLLFPFTYFIFFQYTIVARSYVLILPILMAIANIYPNKREHLIKYGVLLFLLMNVSSHCFFLAGGLWLDFLIEILLEKRRNKIKIDKKEVYFLLLLVAAFIEVIMFVIPAPDCAFRPSTQLETANILGEALISNSGNAMIYYFSSFIYICLICYVLKNKQNIFKILTLIIPNLVWITCISGAAPQHFGILFIILIFFLTITDSIKEHKSAQIILTICCCIQIFYTIQCCINDFNYKYSVGEDVKEYLETVEYDKKKIAGVDFYCVQVNAYCDKNIFDNYSKSYASWKKSDFVNHMAKTIYSSEEQYDIYVIPDWKVKMKSEKDAKQDREFEEYYNSLPEEAKFIYKSSKSKLMDKLEKSGEYTCKHFEGNMYYKDKIFETTGLYVYVKK